MADVVVGSTVSPQPACCALGYNTSSLPTGPSSPTSLTEQDRSLSYVSKKFTFFFVRLP